MHLIKILTENNKMNTIEKMTTMEQSDIPVDDYKVSIVIPEIQDTHSETSEDSNDEIVSSPAVVEDELETFCKKKTSQLYVHTEEERLKNIQCCVCERPYFWVESKEQLMELIELKVHDDKPFVTEIAKLRYYIHLPCDDISYFSTQEHKCWMCLEKEKKCGIATKKQIIQFTIPIVMVFLFLAIVIYMSNTSTE